MNIKQNFKKTELPSWKRVLYTLCFFLICVIDQRSKTVSRVEYQHMLFLTLWPVPLGLLVLSHHARKICRHWPFHLGWVLVSIASACVFEVFIDPFHMWQLALTIFASAQILGMAILETIFSWKTEKPFTKLAWRPALLWLVMMLLMVLSRSDYQWPFWYLVAFPCLYLTVFTAEEQEDLFQGLLNGLILALLAFQAYCCVFRPYDQVRYVGIYTNSNSNALFYCLVLIAFFVKILYVTKGKKSLLWRIFYWLGAGAVYSLLFMTIGRFAWIISFFLGLIFLLSYCILTKKSCFLRRGAVLVVCMLLTFPAVFSLVRYMPPLFHHPVWFAAEYSPSKVHSWDPWDSDKYINLDDLLEYSLGRIASLIPGSTVEAKENVTTAPSVSEPTPTPASTEETEIHYIGPVDPSDPRVTTPPLTFDQDDDPYLVRMTIYKTIFSKLNLTGHLTTEQGFYLTPGFWVYHAHDIYLQYGMDFGIPVMLLFIALNIWCTIRMVKKMLHENPLRYLGYLMIMQLPLIFGLIEYSWGSGSATIFLLFVMWGIAFRTSPTLKHSSSRDYADQL